MSNVVRRTSRLTSLMFVLSVISAPTALLAQTPEDSPPGASNIKDLPLPPAARSRLVGLYSVSEQGKETPPMSFRFYSEGEALMGQMNDNDPTRMLYQGGAVFRPEAAPVFVVTFTGEGARASGLSVVYPDGTMAGTRVDEAGPVRQPMSATSGTVFDELARMDRLVFDATYVTCDADRAHALFTDDAEFYHDKTGFTSGEELRNSFTRLAHSCPAAKGITRELVPGSLHVYPISEYGAVQMGEHRFVERGATSVTIARFVHLWQKTADGWKISRALSFDHQPK